MDHKYLNYYKTQSGHGLLLNEPDFGGLIRSPKLLQRGRGLGGVFSSVFRYLKPLLYSGLNYFKDQALDAGSQFLSGRPVNEILKEKGLQAVDKLRDKAAEKISKMSGAGRKKKRKSLKNKKKTKKTKKSIKSRVKRKRAHSRTARKTIKTKKQFLKDIFSNGNLHD